MGRDHTSNQGHQGRQDCIAWSPLSTYVASYINIVNKSHGVGIFLLWLTPVAVEGRVVIDGLESHALVVCAVGSAAHLPILIPARHPHLNVILVVGGRA